MSNEGWDSQAPTPTASTAVSRSPTLVDLPSHNNLDSTIESLSKADHGKQLAEAEDTSPSHRHHLSHLKLPPHPHQHLDQYYPPENYESLDEIAREKEEARERERNGEEVVEEKGEEKVAKGGGADDFPDGGLRAWLVVAGAWSVSFATWGYINSFGVILSYTIENSLSDYTESEIAWIGSFQIAAVLFTAVISGKTFDVGYVKHLMVIGLLIYTAGLFGLSYATSYAEFFLAQGVACGLASGILFLPACSAVSHYFKKKRSLALGVLATGSSLGGVMFPSMLNKLIYSVGFGWAIRIAGFIVVACLIFATLVIDARLPPRKSGRFLDFAVFKDLPFTVYTFGAAFVWLGLYLPIFYNEQYAMFHGVERDIAFYSLSILNAASVFGRTIPNYFADSYGALTVLVPSCTMSGILIFAWIGLLKTKAGTIVFCLIFGFCQGTFVSMLPASVASLTTDMSSIGIRLAMNFLAQSPFALVGTPMSGGIISAYPGQKGYTIAACVAGGLVLVGSFGIAVARSMSRKDRKCAKGPDLLSLEPLLSLDFASPLLAHSTMSVDQPQSTKRIKQEEEGESVPGGGSADARPQPTSFLDLPDDLLLPIFEEFYEQRYASSITTTTPLRIAEILVNKRIYFLARPLWYKRLSINEQQLDVRLAGMLSDGLRHDSLRFLAVSLIPSLANLTTFGISRLLKLQNLYLILPEIDLSNDTLERLAESISELEGLKRITLSSLGGLTSNDRFWAYYIERKRQSIPSLVLQKRKRTYCSIVPQGSLERRTYTWQPGSEPYSFKTDWSNLLSLHLRGVEALRPMSWDVVYSLRSALESGQSLPLQRLSLYLRFDPTNRPEDTGLFTPALFRELFELLGRTNINKLELERLQEIPVLGTGCTIASLQVLYLGGSVTLKRVETFQILLTLLLAFPSLRQLHLEGLFLGSDSTAALMSKFDTMPLYFRYSQLCSLLTYLKQSQVLIFTYRGPKEQREMRWTRIDTQAEFDRDCWTL